MSNHILLKKQGSIPQEVLLGLTPIGGVSFWFKTLVAGTSAETLPDNWVECNGQTLNDSESPLNGLTIPDINGENRYLRGNSTSGGTTGASTHTHNINSGKGGSATISSPSATQTVQIGAAVAASSNHVHTLGGTTESESSLPPTYDAVVIMRIK